MRPDPSAVRLAVARRVARGQESSSKLALLRLLQRRYVECRLPRESESRIEQSFNEQLFARILGYSTMFSHESLPYHLRPKNYAVGARRYDDFSLGTFWGDERDLVVASAEFKDPGCDLDAPQTDRNDKLSPVAQAFRAARGFPSCRWVIVSNFRDLRLYSLADESGPLIALDLHEVRTARQLAMLSAHFDYDALIGTRGKAGMTIALDPSHPSTPIPASENAFRVVCTFTPRLNAIDLSLTSIYDAVRDAAVDVLKVKRDQWERSPTVPIRLEDGWVSVDSERARLAMSVEGQVRCSLRHPRESSAAQINPIAEFRSIAHDLGRFLATVKRLFRAHDDAPIGIVSFELREIRGWQIYFQASDLLLKSDDTNSGIAESDEIFSGDAEWTVGAKSAEVAANCMGELAVQFKSHEGRRVRFDHAALAKHLEPEP